MINLKEVAETLIQIVNNEEQLIYLKDILYDFWELQEDRIKKSINLGEAKAKKLINVTEG